MYTKKETKKDIKMYIKKDIKQKQEKKKKDKKEGQKMTIAYKLVTNSIFGAARRSTSIKKETSETASFQYLYNFF